MIRTKVSHYGFATECKKCGNLLTNPGYSKQSVFCCGKYRKWYDWIEETTTFDDGRDDHGRFHHPSKIISKQEEILLPGGE